MTSKSQTDYGDMNFADAIGNFKNATNTTTTGTASADPAASQEATDAAALEAAVQGGPIPGGGAQPMTSGGPIPGGGAQPMTSGASAAPTGGSTGASTSTTTSSTSTSTGLASLDAVLAAIATLTEQMGAAGNKQPVTTPTVVGSKTVRRIGGMVDTVAIMSDGSQGQVLDTYQDLGAKESVMKMFENLGLGADFVSSLTAAIDDVYALNIMPTDAQLLNSIYSSDAYTKRFAANEDIRKRIANGTARPGDRLLTPSEYIATEDGFRSVMAEAGLPVGFYDNPSDFTNLIANGVSVGEVTSRVNIAKDALTKADTATKDALKNYYGLTTEELTAYLLDPEKAYNLITSKFNYSTEDAKNIYGVAQVGGASERAGAGLASQGFSQEIYNAGQAPNAQTAFQYQTENQNDYTRLLGLSGQTAGGQDLVRQQLGLAGGESVTLNTKKLASQERARFKQQSAVGNLSLSHGRKQKSDV